MYLEWL